MKKETVPPIKLNDQAALDYTLYMMLTGCFKKTKCKSQALEEQLYLRYRNQSSIEKEVLENICVGITDFFLPSKVPSEIWKYMVEIQLEKNPEDAFTTVIADGGFFVLRALLFVKDLLSKAKLLLVLKMTVMTRIETIVIRYVGTRHSAMLCKRRIRNKTGSRRSVQLHC